jgi:hypothetical protein
MYIQLRISYSTDSWQPENQLLAKNLVTKNGSQTSARRTAHSHRIQQTDYSMAITKQRQPELKKQLTVLAPNNRWYSGTQQTADGLALTVQLRTCYSTDSWQPENQQLADNLDSENSSKPSAQQKTADSLAFNRQRNQHTVLYFLQLSCNLCLYKLNKFKFVYVMSTLNFRSHWLRLIKSAQLTNTPNNPDHRWLFWWTVCWSLYRNTFF